MDRSWQVEPGGERACSVIQNGGEAEASAHPCPAQASSNSVAERSGFGPGHRARKHVSHLLRLTQTLALHEHSSTILGCWTTAKFVTLLGCVVPRHDGSRL